MQWTALRRNPIVRYVAIWSVLLTLLGMANRFVLMNWLLQRTAEQVVQQQASFMVQSATQLIVEQDTAALIQALRRYNELVPTSQLVWYDDHKQPVLVLDYLSQHGLLQPIPTQIVMGNQTELKTLGGRQFLWEQWHHLPDGGHLFLRQVFEPAPISPMVYLSGTLLPMLLVMIFIGGLILTLRRVWLPMQALADQSILLESNPNHRLTIQTGLPDQMRIQTTLNRLSQRLHEGQQRLSSQRQWLRLMLEHNPIALLQIDRHGIIHYMNIAAERLIGQVRTQVYAQSIDNLIEIDKNSVGNDPFFPDLKTLDHDVNFQAKLIPQHQTDEGHQLQVWLKPPTLLVEDNASVDQDRLVMALLDDNETQRQRTVQLQQLKEYEKTLELTKQEFATLTHELRTPLNGITGMLQLLSHTPLTPEQREYLHTLDFSAQAMLRLINDTLDMAKLEAGQMQLDEVEFDLLELVQEVIDLMAASAINKGVEPILTVEPDLPRYWLGDSHRIRQVLLNLLNNAIKFTTAGQYVALTVKRTVQPLVDDRIGSVPRTTLELAIQDNGPGIAPDQQEKLFGFFRQANAAVAREHGGTGLGLAISQGLAKAMSGQITLSSTLDVGTAFYFHVPLRVADQLPVLQRPPLQLPICLVTLDDNAINQQFYAELADYLGWSHVISASTVLPLQLPEPDLHRQVIVLMDNQWAMRYQMNPEHLKTRSSLWQRALFVLLSTQRPRSLEAAFFQQFDGFISKPLHPRALLAELIRLTQPALPDDIFEIESPLGGLQKDKQSIEAFMAEHALERTPVIRSLETGENDAEFSQNNAFVLLAEDNPINQKVATKMLERLGYRYKVVGDGQAAIDLLEREARNIHLILMDCRMPVLDGLAATQEIRRLNYSLPIIALTANDTDEDRQACHEAGMDDFLAKPIRQETLQQMLLKYWH